MDSNRLEIRFNEVQKVLFGFQRSSCSAWDVSDLAVPNDFLLRSSRLVNPEFENKRLRIRVHWFRSWPMFARRHLRERLSGDYQRVSGKIFLVSVLAGVGSFGCLLGQEVFDHLDLVLDLLL